MANVAILSLVMLNGVVESLSGDPFVYGSCLQRFTIGWKGLPGTDTLAY